LRYEYNSSINSWDMQASDSTAWFSRLISQRVSGQYDRDVAYCIANNLVSTQLNADAQLVFMERTLSSLKKYEEESEEPESEEPESKPESGEPESKPEREEPES